MAFKLPRLTIKKTYFFLKRYYRWLLVIVFVLLLIFNAWIYYQYTYLAMKGLSVGPSRQLEINQEKLNQVLEKIKLREENLVRIEGTLYKDPFSP